MLRGFGLSLALIVAAVEPLAGDTDLVKYAVTQGGLLAVVLVLLWSYRRELKRQLDDKEAERERQLEEKEKELDEKEQRLQVFMTLVTQSTTALTRSADACDRMARAAENLERRR